MTRDTESLIRQAFEAEADRAVDARLVLAELERRKPRRRGALIVLTAAAVVVAVAAAVVVPQLLRNPALPVGTAPVEQNILIAGLDDNGFTDSIVLAHLGKDGSGSAVALPRDTEVDIPGQGPGRLNSAYRAGGAEALKTTVQNLTGVKIDHYAMVDMAGVAKLSTAVGGVPVCLRNPSHDPYSGASLPAGNQTLSGAQALSFLRQRFGLPNGDLDRIARLQLFMRSLAKQALGKLTDGAVIAAVRDSVHTDAGWNPLTAAGMLRGNVSTATIPVDSPDNENMFTAEPAKVREFVQDFTASPPPADDAGCVN
ncbi:LytR family transcriptional regulator [Amycolatopsis acidicola]|uniref:LytR family transcriptional regulator n=1 Tax=Amycolatopsis acidicola TaxID=2596893 RepID=A0A5N0V035_9PSEU|nr:LCP family protein [Amycolatopsis acidicola]KAA9159771.1 LytR family transcriptional regulator [Amycolatopsis acidicola]